MLRTCKIPNFSEFDDVLEAATCRVGEQLRPIPRDELTRRNTRKETISTGNSSYGIVGQGLYLNL